MIGIDGNGTIKLRKTELVTEWAVILKEGTVIGNWWDINRKLVEKSTLHQSQHEECSRYYHQTYIAVIVIRPASFWCDVM